MSDAALAGLLNGMHSWEAKRAADRLKQVQQAAKVVRSGKTGSSNTALAKVMGVSVPKNMNASLNTSGLDKLSRYDTLQKLGNINFDMGSLLKLRPKEYTDFGATQSQFADKSGVSSTNYNPGPDVWDVMDIKGFDPYSFSSIPVGKTGKTVTVNSAVADRYSGFLNDLLATGYKIDSIGGQVTRNARGSNRPSLHSYGLAIDINPAQNPMTGSLITNMPPNIRDIAAKYNLVWGGDWNGSTKDTMHFSFPYGGGK